MLSESEKLEQIVKATLIPVLTQVKEFGLRSSIEKLLPGFFVNDFIMKKIKRSLRIIKSIDLGKFLGKINIYYKVNSIRLDFVGLISIFINQIVISEEKIIEIIDSIFVQIEEIFFTDENYLVGKINKILKKLTKKEIFTTSDFGEKSLYDFVLVILLNYYNSIDTELPDWFELALGKIDKTNLAKDFVDFFSNIIVKIFEGISNNVYIDYDIIFNSKILRFLLNKNTNSGKISDVLSFFNINIKETMDKFVKDYAGTAFLKGLGEHITNIIQDMLMGVSDDVNIKTSSNEFNFTSCLGETINSRRFRWFGSDDIDEYLEISENKNFNRSIIIRAQKENIILSRPTIFDLGTIAKYQIEPRVKYSVSLSNFKTDTEYFLRIKRYTGDYINKFIINSNSDNNFIVMSDSQGMVKKDYEVFLRAFESILESYPKTQFVAHLGDFVDDGSNENYWDYLLNSKSWGQIPVLPASGNHESKFHPTLKYAGVRNSIINHFNVNYPNQNNLDKGLYYSFEHNNCLFVIFNTNIQGGLGKEQIKWANKVFEESDSKWKVIFIHKSPYSNGPHNDDPDVELIRREVNELCFKFKVDIVFGGHDHVYSRAKPSCFGKPTCEEIKNDTIFNPDGTIFVTLGPVGVKNYKIYKNKTVNNEVILSLRYPSFANVVVSNHKMSIEIYEFSNKFKLVDCFYIVKDEKRFSTDQVKKSIENFPVIPWLLSESRVEKILCNYNILNKDEKKLVSINKLNKAMQYNSSLKKIINGNISFVFNKKEFMKALENQEIRTIIIKSDIIKFESKFGMGRKVKISRDIQIKGSAKLKFVTFVVKPNINLYIGESIIIDNNRKRFSLYPSISSFVLHENSSLILQDNSWIEQSSGWNTKKKSMIKFCGRNINIFINSENLKCIPKNFVKKKYLANVFNIFE